MIQLQTGTVVDATTPAGKDALERAPFGTIARTTTASVWAVVKGRDGTWSDTNGRIRSSREFNYRLELIHVPEPLEEVTFQTTIQDEGWLLLPYSLRKEVQLVGEHGAQVEVTVRRVD